MTQTISLHFSTLTEHCHDEEDETITADELRMRINQLPKVVQEFFKKVCNDANNYADEDIYPFSRLLRIEQKGQFLLNGDYIPFTANQEFRTSYKHAGFVWEANMKSAMGCIPVNISVCDAYIEGEGIMWAQLPGGIPIVRPRQSHQLNVGELLRWAVEAVLFPLALLPPINSKRGDGIAWLTSENEVDNSATLELEHHGITVNLIFHFNPITHLVTSIRCRRPRSVGNDKYEMTSWSGYCYDWKVRGGLLVPTRMECGWHVDEDKPPEIYFKGTNNHFVYLMNSHPIACKHHHAE